MSKACTKCGETKLLAEFYKEKSKEGTTKKCKACLIEYARARRKTPEGKAVAAANERTPKRIASRAAYFASDASKALQKAWRESPSGKASAEAHKQTDLYKASLKRGQANHHAKYPSRRQAGNEINMAIRRGEMVRAAELPRECESAECYGRNEYHHDSYRREDWLNVRVLCVRHHKRWHRKNNPIEPESEVAEAVAQG